jgi:diguanylate cyclase (GGDEF)-like protein/PAS domain S-box-containing protein
LDVMAEGVILLDQDERIVLANSTFSEWIGKTPSELMGVKASTLGWSDPYAEDHVPRYPWRQAIESAEAFTGVRLFLSTEEGDGRAILVNGAPILDGWGRAKGAIATFDDVTELERNKAELEHVLAELQKSQEEIQLQNEELQLLATRDPLTGVANRRSFLEGFAQEFERSKLEGRKLCCLMVDIDNFKRINDTHGHATGDEVIRRVSDALGGAVRSTDGVCRYGGEEFCIALPTAPIEEAVQVAERIRAQIDSPGFARVPVTASFGVSAIGFGASTPEQLINQADEAMYASKESGRNRVTRWDQRPRTDG